MGLTLIYLPRLVFILLLTALPSLSLMAEDHSAGADPRINQPYQDPDFQVWQDIFESPGREVYDDREAILQALNLETGMWVADIGAGTGLFTWLFATEVGDQGRVFAVDISSEFIRNILQIARQSNLKNVQGIVNSQTSLALQPDTMDVVFVCDTYHHFEQPQVMLKLIHQSLKSGGRLVVIDYRKRPGFSSNWVMDHVRLDRDGVIAEIEQSGFRLSGEENFLRANYFLTFTKK
ncbi:MAG: methyltransferase domain-containing protein [Candidatus Thiodiazotropha lotti]|uniref:Methyltransferase domain-containing protein n=1 Tax=Candidatus Thiodiazotropha endoloripes TaxID=1818881 RepID=A0A1E2UUE4_9GAMM|nr:methyltransferase domain-containing protein [Candidatus Thiodiazotropha endoloripes]MCG7899977.1 methyltransferase domain-containing protein [Candidatus Thiodiazotropha weberae]MCG7993198.1 methyltransferase domain-containing protein [Candidatus Thiodiazotropha lotti]MCG7904735.1 methyltransferase domain-containing protein [Candidatus Thiodiazotropha weberae]MCG7915387.1 methyltransferase domain-containing protein [Candidatus Thiodiazotropha weberae]MCG8001770.1 methyltransferase domain-con